MTTPTNSTFACRYCRHYTPQGRRGGHCQQLNVTVQGSWRACSLAIPPFQRTWNSLGDVIHWQPMLPLREVTNSISAGAERALETVTIASKVAEPIAR
ncbi:hypothetical protein [Leptolyngbya sp. FACHB-36]|uniref:hypothetical protein n=1 Tax=Leptolyngbya sp. FACHB-36 TaxID=2692808 RepID=UPI00321FBAF9